MSRPTPAEERHATHHDDPTCPTCRELRTDHQPRRFVHPRLGVASLREHNDYSVIAMFREGTPR